MTTTIAPPITAESAAPPSSPTCRYPACPRPAAPRTKAAGRPPEYCDDARHNPKSAHLERARRAATGVVSQADAVTLIDDMEGRLTELKQVVLDDGRANPVVVEARDHALRSDEAAAAAALEAARLRTALHEETTARSVAEERAAEAVSASAQLVADHDAALGALCGAREAHTLLAARVHSLEAEVEGWEAALTRLTAKQSGIDEAMATTRAEMAQLRAGASGVRSQVVGLADAVRVEEAVSARAQRDALVATTDLATATMRIGELTAAEAALRGRLDRVGAELTTTAVRAAVAERAAEDERARRQNAEAGLAAATRR